MGWINTKITDKLLNSGWTKTNWQTIKWWVNQNNWQIVKW
jgi:hypothetical protein